MLACLRALEERVARNVREGDVAQGRFVSASMLKWAGIAPAGSAPGEGSRHCLAAKTRSPNPAHHWPNRETTKLGGRVTFSHRRPDRQIEKMTQRLLTNAIR